MSVPIPALSPKQLISKECSVSKSQLITLSIPNVQNKIDKKISGKQGPLFRFVDCFDNDSSQGCKKSTIVVKVFI